MGRSRQAAALNVYRLTATSVVSKDGKTRTITATGVNAQGQKINNVSVYDKK